MGEETERKFLVSGDAWRARVRGSRRIVQGYLALGDEAEIRVRISDDAEAWLTIKSAKPGLARKEFEYAIPLADAKALIQLRQGRLIAKCRHSVADERGRTWEVDVFEGDHAGLCLAELELAPGDEGPGKSERPAWLGEEVTGDPAYYNASLARRE